MEPRRLTNGEDSSPLRLSTRGACFVCSERSFEEKEKFCSISTLLRHLDIQPLSAAPSSEEKLDVETELCERCENVISTLSESAVQLRGLQLKISSCLNIIQARIESVTRSKMKEDCGDNGNSSLVDVETVDTLRNLILNHCTRKISTGPPIVILNRVNPNLVSKEGHLSATESYSDVVDDEENEVAVQERAVIDMNLDNSMESEGEEMRKEEESEIFEKRRTPKSSGYSYRTSLKEGAYYLCQYCGRGFATNSNRKEHERIHTGSKSYVCPICGKAFVQISNLKKHVATHKDVEYPTTGQKQPVKESYRQRIYSEDREFKCNVCSRAYNYASLLKRHMRIHTGDRYSCDDCDMEFHELASLRYHRKKVHTGERISCSHCDKKFIMTCDLKKHLKVYERDGHCAKPIPIERVVVKSKPSSSSSTKARNLSSSNINRTTTSTVQEVVVVPGCAPRFRYILPKSDGSSTGIQNEARDTISFSTNADVAVQETEAPVETSMDPNRLPIVTAKRRKSVEARQEFNEDIDPESYYESVKAKGSNQLTLPVCEICQRKLEGREKLLLHIKHIHIRPFKCDMCEKAFHSKAALEIHRRPVHFGQKRYVCVVPECSKGFSRKDYLISHLKSIHHIYDYDDANKTNAGVSDAHEMKDTNYTGNRNEAKNTISAKPNADEAVQGKAGDNSSRQDVKRYVCVVPECSKGFSQKANLLLHLKSHLNDIYEAEKTNVEVTDANEMKEDISTNSAQANLEDPPTDNQLHSPTDTV